MSLTCSIAMEYIYFSTVHCTTCNIYTATPRDQRKKKSPRDIDETYKPKRKLSAGNSKSTKKMKKPIKKQENKE